MRESDAIFSLHGGLVVIQFADHGFDGVKCCGQLQIPCDEPNDFRIEEHLLLFGQPVQGRDSFLFFRHHKHEIGSTKRKKVRTVDFGNALADILKKARKQQLKNRMQYGELYHRNFYREVTEKNRLHYEYYNLPMTEDAPEDYTEISFVCLREDGCLELPATVETACRTAARKVPELEGFHFHTLRHTYTTNLLSNGAQPKDVQELLGHLDVSTTMNVYAHATREAKRDSAKLLDKVVGIYLLPQTSSKYPSFSSIAINAG